MPIEIKPLTNESTDPQGPTCDKDGCRPKNKKTIAGTALFIVACALSPCCAPLFVPLVVAAIAGTPLAAWIGLNQGWVYGGLTALSILCAVLGFRWIRGRSKTVSSPLEITTKE